MPQSPSVEDPAAAGDVVMLLTVKPLFIPVVSVGLCLCGLAPLVFPAETETRMSRSGNVRIAGAILLSLVVLALVWGLYLLAVVFALFGAPRLFTPERSIRLQQRLY